MLKLMFYHATIVLCIVLVITAIFFSGCQSPRYVITEAGPQAHYKTGYPARDMSRDLETVFRSVKNIQSTGFYETYLFRKEDRITKSGIRDRDILRLATDRINIEHGKAGTAIILSADLRSQVFITNDHVISFPDTIIQYYSEGSPQGVTDKADQYIESVSIKTTQLNLILDLPEVHAFTILVRDRVNDLALLGVRFSEDREGPIARSLRVNPGDPSKLSMGSFAYILGYPKGYQMVTRAIVSEPNRDRHSSFLLDALFNRGISGGMILAVRGENEDLEWVGMARSGSSTREYILRPEKKDIEEFGVMTPYRGQIFVDAAQRIDYGITFPIPMTIIRRFISENRNELSRLGYTVRGEYFYFSE